MREAFMLAIAVFIGEIIGYWIGKDSAESLDKDRLLELRKYEVDAQYKYIKEFGEGL